MVMCLHNVHTPHLIMTVVSSDPVWWPFIGHLNLLSRFTVVSSAVVVYDWALTFGQEFELVWKKRWSFITVLYVCVRYMGLSYSVINVLWNVPFSITDSVGLIVYFTWIWMPVVVDVMLGVVMMIRIHAMYGRSRKMLIFLVIVLLASTVTTGVMTVMGNIGILVEEYVLSGYHTCLFSTDDLDTVKLNDESVVPTAIWEILAFVLAVWVIIKHFRELRQFPTRSTIGDCFTVLIQSHAFYFVVFAIVACLSLGSLSTYIMFPSSVGSIYYSGIFLIVQELQMFVLGPRLILSIREYHSKLLARSDEGTAMTTIHFQAGGDVLSGGDV